MNWLQRAQREICETAADATANTDERSLSAVSAVRARVTALEQFPSIGSNGSAVSWQMQEDRARDEAFEERAAIMEYDAGLARNNAEQAALAAILNWRLRTK